MCNNTAADGQPIMILKGLGAIRAKIGPTSDVDKIFSKMYSQYKNKNTFHLKLIYAFVKD
jgi:hypothetical protein